MKISQQKISFKLKFHFVVSFMHDVNFPQEMLNGSKDRCDFSSEICTTGDSNVSPREKKI